MRPWYLAAIVGLIGVVAGAGAARADGASPQSPPQAEPVLRLRELLAQIRAESPSLAGAKAWSEAAYLGVRRARALEDPQVTVMTEDLPLGGGAEAMPMVRLQATQMIPWPGKRDRMASVAAREADATSSRAETTRLDAEAEGRRLYFALYQNREARRVNREERAQVDTLVSLATGQLASGMAMHHDVLKMRTEASMLDDELIMLEADRREMAAMLNGLLGRDEKSPVGEPEEAWTPPRALDEGALVKAALERRPELKEMTSMEGMERAMAEVARRERYPDLMVGVLFDTRIDGTKSLGTMVGLNVPLWAGSKQRLDIEAAELRARSVAERRKAMESMTRAEVEKALARLGAAERRLQVIEGEFLPLAEQTYQATLASLPSDKVSSLEVLDALRTVTHQRLARVSMRVERELALVALERATGSPLEETR